MFYAVIMAGGQGTRLWPLSRKKLPKQLHRLSSNKTLIQETYDRLRPIFESGYIYISTTPEYAPSIMEQLPEVPMENYVLEPLAMGNAAACGLVSMVINKRDPDASVIFIPSDHAIKDVDGFRQSILDAKLCLEKYPDHIITIGVRPTKVDTSLGYINIDDNVKNISASNKIYHVNKFIEKPTYDKALSYVESGKYLWNTGTFVWRTDHIILLLSKFMPSNYKILGRILRYWNTPKRESVLEKEYPQVENTSVDYGIMEKTNNILAIYGDFGWSDIGSWGSLFEHLSEVNKSSIISRGHHISCYDNNTMVFASEKLIATIGVNDMVIVDTKDAILICHKDKAQDVKKLINVLKDQGKEKYL